jgi:hypothetical protein
MSTSASRPIAMPTQALALRAGSAHTIFEPALERHAAPARAVAAWLFACSALGVAMPTVLYVIWGVMEIVGIPIAK